MQLLGLIPSACTIHARNPARSFKLGGKHSAFIPMHGARDVLGMDGARGPASKLDLAQFHKLSHLAPEIHALSTGICEPSDMAAPQRHLHMLASAITHSDKAFTGLAANRQQAEDSIAIAGLVFGAEGIITGDGKAACSLNRIRATDPVSEGDEVFSLETPGGFETPLFYGTVTRAELASGATHWDIEVRPAIDPQSTKSVSIVRPTINPKRLAN